MSFEPYQSLAGCITNIRRHLPACDRVIADYRIPSGRGLGSSPFFARVDCGVLVRFVFVLCQPCGSSTLTVNTSSSWTEPFKGNGLTLRVSDQIGCASSPLLMIRPL